MTTTARGQDGTAQVTKIIDVARVTIELCSPLTIGAGAPDDIVDSVCVLDANGLPALPGASLAGVLRDRWRATNGDAVTGVAETVVFGTRLGWEDAGDGRAGRRDDGAADAPVAAKDGARQAPPRVRSRLMTSWGFIHDSGNRPRCGLVQPADIAGDPVLRGARNPIVRQHVRLDARGVADTAMRGLFDERVVALGHRFTFEIVAEDLPEPVVDHVLGILASPATRLGGKTRRGMGRFAIVGGAVRRRRFDLGQWEDFEAYAALPVDLRADVPAGVLDAVPVNALASADVAAATLSLVPRGLWMMGGGAPEPRAPKVDGDSARAMDDGKIDLLPYREPIVVWDRDGGAFDPTNRRVVIPATGIKGALRHRAAFHARAIAGVYADTSGDARSAGEAAVAQAVRFLFGHVEAAKADRASDQVSAGRVIVDDVVLPAAPPTAVVNHVSLDRFTSGPLDGHLFAEAPLWKLAGGVEGVGMGGAGEDAGAAALPASGAITVTVLIRQRGDVPALARQALAAALADLAEGRLQIGAGSGRGNGWFEGTVTWSPGGWATQAPRERSGTGAATEAAMAEAGTHEEGSV